MVFVIVSSLSKDRYIEKDVEVRLEKWPQTKTWNSFFKSYYNMSLQEQNWRAFAASQASFSNVHCQGGFNPTTTSLLWSRTLSRPPNPFSSNWDSALIWAGPMCTSVWLTVYRPRFSLYGYQPGRSSKHPPFSVRLGFYISCFGSTRNESPVSELGTVLDFFFFFWLISDWWLPACTGECLSPTHLLMLHPTQP